MATRVREIMNRELFSVRPDHLASDVLNGILALGITGAPVVDDEGRPVGVVSLHDLVSRTGPRAADLMTSPAATVHADAPIAEAGRLLAETGYHRLVAVDWEGRAVGVVSSLDVIRGLMGLPATHPPAFPHLDPRTQLRWTDDQPLEGGHLDPGATGPGLIVLVHGGATVPERVVWAESCDDVFARLQQILVGPPVDEPVLAWWLARGGLRFRVALASDPARREKVLPRLLSEARLAGAVY
jgi:CBS domain-containing protein